MLGRSTWRSTLPAAGGASTDARAPGRPLPCLAASPPADPDCPGQSVAAAGRMPRGDPSIRASLLAHPTTCCSRSRRRACRATRSRGRACRSDDEQPARPPGHPGAGAGRLRQDLAARAVAARAPGAWPGGGVAVGAAAGRHRPLRAGPGAGGAHRRRPPDLRPHAARGGAAPAGLEGVTVVAGRGGADGARHRADRRRGRPAARQPRARRWPTCCAMRRPICARGLAARADCRLEIDDLVAYGSAHRRRPGAAALPARRDDRAGAQRASARASTATRPHACTN